MNRIDRGYINRRSEDQLREELLIELEKNAALRDAFKSLPECPEPLALNALHYFADFERDWLRGKELQRTHDVPPNTECEMGAGLWVLIRNAILAAQS